MKKILFVCFIVFFYTHVTSQIEISMGTKLGGNISNLTGLDENPTTQLSRSFGLQAGLFLNLHLSDFYELQVETMYSSQGAKYEYDEFDFVLQTTVRRNDDVKLNYIGLGIANKFFLIEDIGFNLIIGPGIDILVSSENVIETIPIDFVFFGGIGYEFPFGLGLEARYKQGVIPVLDDFLNDRPTALNSVIQLGATYRFTFNK